jgi:tetratricopeptide (TPR) repeat protein
MRPLDPLASTPSVEQHLRSAPPEEVKAELARLEQSPMTRAAHAARIYAEGALALREGRLDDACRLLAEAAPLLAEHVDAEAGALGECESWLSRIRRGPRAVYGDAVTALEALAARHPSSALVQVVALHYRGTALRYAGQAEATLGVLLEAFGRSEGLLSERAQVLNSLGTLYVLLGAYGAAHAVLEHAAELNHQIGDRVGEAISYGQLGSAAVALGELETARRHFQRQEWLASRLGDHFGQARALTMLGDLAIDMGRPDDALMLAEQARTVASSVEPPLAMWVAYSSRTIGRAKLELGDGNAVQELEEVRERFHKIGNQLGEAMVEWDLARHAGRSVRSEASESAASARWFRTAWAFATLGLTSRVAQVLRDLRRLHTTDEERRAGELAIAAASQSFPHLSSTQEVELVYSEPDTLAVIATRRIEGQRNLGRLAALRLAGHGLAVAAVASSAIGTREHAIPTRRSAAVLLGQLPGVALLGWGKGSNAAEIARDLSSLRAASGEDARAALGFYPGAHVTAVPFAGELGVTVAGAELTSLVRAVLASEPASLWRDGQIAWDGEAEALARMGGYAPSTEGTLG